MHLAKIKHNCVKIYEQFSLVLRINYVKYTVSIKFVKLNRQNCKAAQNQDHVNRCTGMLQPSTDIRAHQRMKNVQVSRMMTILCVKYAQILHSNILF